MGIKLLTIAFYFIGNTLFWVGIEHNAEGIAVTQSPSYWLKFQLDHKMPPTTNEDNIESIKVNEDTVEVYTKEKLWILHYTNDPDDAMNDLSSVSAKAVWWVEDWINVSK